MVAKKRQVVRELLTDGREGVSTVRDQLKSVASFIDDTVGLC